MKNKTTLLNVISSFLLQIISTISGLIVPRIILAYFGSDVNGLIGSLGQILSYVTLVEGGVTGVVLANMYKPLIDKDFEKLSSIMVTARKFYRRIAMIAVGYILAVAFIFPLVKKTGFGYGYVCSLTLIISVTLLIQYLFALSLQTLLDADKKVYIVSFTQIIITILNVVLVLISVNIYPSIHLLKFVSGSLFVLQPLVYGIYIKNHYPINWKAGEDKSLLKNRWDGFAINIAAFIHGCTDVVVLTIFTDFKTVSVYNVYLLVVNGLRKLVVSILAGLDPALGQAYARGDKKELEEKLCIYEYIDFMLVFFIFSVCGLLITPFVILYTKGINDADYNRLWFGVVMVLSEALYILKFPHMNLAYTAGKFKELTVPAYIEAGLNIVSSLIFVKLWGIIGVVAGTCLAMSFRLIYHVFFTKKLIEGRKQFIYYRKLLLFALVSFLGIAICVFAFPLKEITIAGWVIHAFIYSGVIGGLLLVLSLLLFRPELRFFIKYLRRK